MQTYMSNTPRPRSNLHPRLHFRPPNVNSFKNSTRIPAPKAAASDARRKLFSAKPSVHRNLSFQEPTRLPMRPKVAGRSSSYDTGVDDPVYRYQAYAEDSWEDSPEGSIRTAPGSWRDV